MSLPVPSLWGSSFIGNWYIPVLNQKTLKPPLPHQTIMILQYNHVFVSYTMVQMFALLISFH